MGLPLKGGFAGVKESSFDALEGTFNAKLVKVTWKEARPETVAKWQAKGHQGEEHGGVLTWEFDITQEGYEGRKAWYRTSLIPEGKSMTLAVLLALGHTRDELDAPDFTYEDPSVDYGKDVTLKCKPQRDDDTQTDVKAVMSPRESSSLLP